MVQELVKKNNFVFEASIGPPAKRLEILNDNELRHDSSMSPESELSKGEPANLLDGVPDSLKCTRLQRSLLPDSRKVDREGVVFYRGERNAPVGSIIPIREVEAFFVGF